ncbi:MULTISPECIES: PPA1309 family protein [unclassified Streptomyces]|uniref:PPA1309 family protein n=1 Tax=unclassified Streptomyces TaxID=2593676 RepID=UPI0021563258|nr:MULTISPECIES: PPA1309 family protein [unclassified Streptomyces]
MDNTHSAPSGAGQMATAPLTRAVLEIDGHVSGLGWDRPALLFALVDTAQLRSQEPSLAERIGLDPEQGDQPGGSLTPVEQEEIPQGTPLDEFLATIAWPDAVVGCALTVERLMLPPAAEAAVPDELRKEENADALTKWVVEHPERQEVRMTVGVLRDGAREAAIRLRAKDSDTEVLTGRDLVPGLADALSATFEE